MAGDADGFRARLAGTAVTAVWSDGAVAPFRTVENRRTEAQRRAEADMRPLGVATADDHWRLARLNRKMDLPHRYRSHLRVAAALDPFEAAYRKSLGQRRIDGAWFDPEVAAATRAFQEAFDRRVGE